MGFKRKKLTDMLLDDKITKETYIVWDISEGGIIDSYKLTFVLKGMETVCLLFKPNAGQHIEVKW